MLTPRLEQWASPPRWPERDLVYGWTINKLFIRESVVLKDTKVIIRVKQTFDSTVITNNSRRISLHAVIITMDATCPILHKSATMSL